MRSMALALITHVNLLLCTAQILIQTAYARTMILNTCVVRVSLLTLITLCLRCFTGAKRVTNLAVATAITTLSLGCGPTSDAGNADTPEGVELLRSSFEREIAPASSSAEQAQLGLSSRAFALELYAQAARGQTDNLFLSPYSVSVALAMTYAGARGDTKTELASALHFDLPEPQLHKAWNAVDFALSSRASGDGLQLEITNALFAQTGFTPNRPFLDTLAVSYGGGLYATDFEGDPERARVSINDWTAQRTHDRIQELLPKSSLEGAMLVLVNAIYFKADWLSPFDPANTRREVFHAPGADVMVEMMHTQAGRYAMGDGYQAVELQYSARNVSMFFIVPDAGRYAAIEAGLNAAFFDDVHGALSTDYDVALGLPRFKFEGATVDLSDALAAQGMRKAFTSSADFSGIGGAPGELGLSGVLQQAFIAVDETGTEAAAATAGTAGPVSAPPRKKEIALSLDRPFLFAIYDQPTGQILFTGRVMHPAE
jgi:serpin B